MNLFNHSENLKNIEAFLVENEIPFTRPDEKIFLLKDGQLEIRYVNSLESKIGYKRFGYNGLSQKHAFEISRQKEEKGVRVMWWRDFECANPRKNNVIKSYLLAACGKVKNRVFARNCEIREVPTGELRSFLDTNCFYGYRSASLNLGLYTKKDCGAIPTGTLVMVWTLGHAFYGQKKYDLEIIRASTLLNTQVIGGASKLWASIKARPIIRCGKQDIKWDSCIFYVDQCHNTGKSLPTLGFKFIGYSGGGFMNINLETGEAFNRKPMIHKQVMQWMAEGKVVSVPLAGVKSYIFCKNDDYSKYPLVRDPQANNHGEDDPSHD